MASFSFGAGNAGKLLRIPLYVLGRIATALIPRSRDEWVFGCAVGIADGALALWRRAEAEGTRAVWLVDDGQAAAARDRGIRTVTRHSVRGFWRTARARVIVVTHGFGDVNRYAATGGVVVQLWHGIPLKRIGLDAPVTTHSPVPFARAFLASSYRRTQARIRVLPAASQLVRGRLESAFGLPSSCVPVTGDPRVDVLSAGTPAERRASARAGLAGALGEDIGDRRVVLYAPTWRDGAPDPAAPTPEQWRLLLDVLRRHDAVLAIRSHPLGRGEYAPPVATDRVRALGSDLVADVTPLLPAMDVLVTDYSSLAYDAGLVPLPTVYLAPDIEDYARSRGFYGTYRDVAGDDPARDWRDAAAQLDAVWSDPAEHARRRAAAEVLSLRVHAFRDGRNTDRVYRAITARLRGDT
ncbi:CDP-glycerol glycerophosphotransferase family protein [Microbacterium sp. No. 7]|uniref:CDP-glycerol glycerophosphotransferase family protein n=1 Tax=Microbacterium sp. No. 7 TaxID=1714373 RepID=UPI0006D10AC7|nr:CDP-glycerol glycerophosphotransferase family protein [Microbacterium sp. No. 7]ALJ19981.1 glycosyl/glycerophosphate transferase [Microbacterium sp. No. 7]